MGMHKGEMSCITGKGERKDFFLEFAELWRGWGFAIVNVKDI